MAKVSIIIPVYNVEQYIQRALDSVARQTLSDIEIILVDDASTDRSAEIIRQYAARDPRIKLIYHECNKSSSQARKAGVLSAQGEFIMFMDSDDEFREDACEVAFQAIIRKKTDMVQFRTLVVNDGNVPDQRYLNAVKFMEPYPRRYTDKENLLYACFMENRWRFSIWNKIYRADICKQAFSYVEDDTFFKAQDLYAFFLISYFCKTYSSIKATLYEYRFGRGISGHQVMSLAEIEKYCTQVKVEQAIKRFLIQQGAFSAYEDIYNRIAESLLSECVYAWQYYLPSEYSAEGFDCLVRHWGGHAVTANLAKHRWHQRSNTAGLIRGAHCIAWRQRPIKTVGIYYHNMRNGGIQRVISKLIELLADHYRIVLITDQAASADDYELPAGITRVVIPSSFEFRREKYAIRATELQNAAKTYDIDCVLYEAWVSPCLLWDMLTIQLAGAACLIHLHNTFGYLFMALDFNFTDAYSIYKQADRLIALSQVDEEFWNKTVGNTVKIPNPNPIRSITSQGTNQKRDPKMILWLGRISREKNPGDVIPIMKRVLQKKPDAKLVVVGSGDHSLHERLKSDVAENNLKDSIQLVDYTPEVEKYYARASVFILTSKYEGFSMTILESKTFGVPIVTYDMPYLDFIRDGRGIVTVPLQDFEAMSTAIVEILTDKEKQARMSEEAVASLDMCDNESIKQRWLALFDGLSTADTHNQIARQNITTTESIMWDTLSRFYEFGMKMQKANAKRPLMNLQGGAKCLSDHGLNYTIRRAIEHLGIPMNAELPRAPARRKRG